MSDLPKAVHEKIYNGISQGYIKEFYRGIATGKVTIANMVKDKLDGADQSSSAEELLVKIHDVIRFCEITSKVTPEIEMSIIKKDR